MTTFKIDASSPFTPPESDEVGFLIELECSLRQSISDPDLSYLLEDTVRDALSRIQGRIRSGRHMTRRPNEQLVLEVGFRP